MNFNKRLKRNIEDEFADELYPDVVYSLLAGAGGINFSKILQLLGQKFKVDGAFIISLFNEGNNYNILNDWTGQAIDNENIKRQGDIRDFKWFAEKLKNDENVIINSEEVLNLKDYRIKAALLVPVYSQNELRGFIGLINTEQSRDWLDREINTVEIVADYLKENWDEWMSRLEYKKIFANTGTATVILNKEGIILETNTEFEQLSGYTAEELEANKSFLEFTHPEDRERLSRYHQKRIRGLPEVPNKYKFDFLTKSGKKKKIFVSVSRIEGTDKSIASLLNITEKNEIINELEKKEVDLKEYEEKQREQLEAINEELILKNREIESAYQKLEELTFDMEKMVKLITEMEDISNIGEDEFLAQLLDTALQVVSVADYGSVFFVEEEKIDFIAARGHDVEILQDMELNKDFLFNQRNVKIVDNPLNIHRSKMEEEEFKRLLKALNPHKQSLVVDFEVNGVRIGGFGLDIAEASKEVFSEKDKRIMKTFRTLASNFIKLKRYHSLQNEFHKEIILSITRMLEIHDSYTRGHSQNVARLAKRVAEEFSLSHEERDKIYWAGLVHDIGKILIPDEILNKSGSLTDEEYKVIKKHPVWGYETLKESEQLKEIAEYILYHHERWDGKGYPEGMKKTEIPLVSQILAVVDSWDAMRSDRTYRDGLTREAAIKELVDNRGTQFAPEVVDKFIQTVDEKYCRAE